VPETATKLTAQSPLAGIREPGIHGSPDPDGPGVTLSEVRNLARVCVMAAGNDRNALAKAMTDGLGLDLPEPNRTTQDKTRLVAFSGLNRYYVMQPKTDGPTLTATLREALGNTATLADQSHGMSVLEISGPAARDVLVKCVPVDLEPKHFAVGDAAVVTVNHIHVLFWRTELDTYRMMGMRGFARDLYEFLATMAAEYGYRVPAA
jgi:sarcosine oxidase subunit gamma